MQDLRDNKLETVWKWFSNTLQDFYPDLEIKSIRRIIFEDILEITESKVISDRDHRLTETEIVKLIKVIRKLKEFVPVQHITGKSHFLEHVFNVNPNVLIPRPETEELVMLAVKKIKQKYSGSEKVRLLDIGTGTGCIAISLAAKLVNVEVTAIDISKNALDTAINNAKEAGVNVMFMNEDILKLETKDSFEVIISNPPYVKESEKQFMQANVLKYEPDIALFVEDSNPLIFYRSILEKAKNTMLVPGGLILFEFNESHSEEMYELTQSYGFNNIQLHNDFRGKPRFMTAVNE